MQINSEAIYENRMVALDERGADAFPARWYSPLNAWHDQALEGKLNSLDPRCKCLNNWRRDRGAGSESVPAGSAAGQEGHEGPPAENLIADYGLSERNDDELHAG